MKKTVSNSLPLTPTAKLQEIAECLQQPLSLAAERPGFSNGQLGIFLFLYAYATHTESDAAEEAARRRLLAAINEFVALSPSPTYYREVAEFGIMLLYLRKQEYLDESFEPLLEQVDLRASHGLAVFIEQQQFDPFVGYLSLAHYFLLRRAAEPLRAVADALLDSYQAQGDAGFWYSTLFGKRQVYLGWSHGVAAVLLFLIQLLHSENGGYRQTELQQVLVGAARYLALPHGHTGRNQYADIVGQSEPSNTLNLCYGDLGIGFVLLQAAQLLADPALQQQALRALTLAASRRDPAQCQVFDASLIYGASGNALLFKYLSQEFPIQYGFQDAAAYWYEQAQQLSQHVGKVAGYQGYYNQHLASAGYSLFEGIAGFGLVLLEFELDTIHPLPLLGYYTYHSQPTL